MHSFHAALLQYTHISSILGDEKYVRDLVRSRAALHQLNESQNISVITEVEA